MPDLASPITTTVTEAMHFQRGLHYLIVRVSHSAQVLKHLLLLFVCSMFPSHLTQQVYFFDPSIKNVHRKISRKYLLFF